MEKKTEHEPSIIARDGGHSSAFSQKLRSALSLLAYMSVGRKVAVGCYFVAGVIYAWALYMFSYHICLHITSAFFLSLLFLIFHESNDHTEKPSYGTTGALVVAVVTGLLAIASCFELRSLGDDCKKNVEEIGAGGTIPGWLMAPDNTIDCSTCYFHFMIGVNIAVIVLLCIHSIFLLVHLYRQGDMTLGKHHVTNKKLGVQHFGENVGL